MRETEIDYEVETYERERVYCDTCGADCTDDYEVQPSEVCPRCADETTSEQFDSLETFLENFQQQREELGGHESDKKPHVFLLFSAIWPLMVVMALADAEDHEYPGTFFIGVAGTMLWVVLPLAFALALVL